MEPLVDQLGNPVPAAQPQATPPAPAATQQTPPAAQPPAAAPDKPDDSVIKFEDFLTAGGIDSVAPKSSTDDKPVTDDKPDGAAAKAAKDKADKEAAELAAKQQTADDVVPVPDKEGKDGRDYSGLDETIVPYFKKMGNKAFNHFKPLYLEHVKAKSELAERQAEVAKLREGRIPDSYYEHELGYTLTPEFERTAVNYNRAQMILNHWEQQMERIRAGEETYVEIVGIDQQTGQFQYSGNIKADKESEAKVRRLVDGSQKQLMAQQMKMQSLGQLHQEQHKQARQQLTEFSNTSFPHFNDPKNAKQAQVMIQDTIQKSLHPAFHNNPLAAEYAKALIVIGFLGKQLKNMPAATAAGTNGAAAGTDGKVIPPDDKRRAGPNNGDITGAGNGGRPANDADSVSFEDFKAVIGRG